MPDFCNKQSDNLRFFSNSSIFTQSQCQSKPKTDPEPFGLSLQEAFPENLNPSTQPFTMNQCPTSTPMGSDNGVDVDYEF